MYLGFLPRQKSARRKFLQEVVAETRTLVLFEAPHRVVASLSDIADVLGNRPMCVARELTKIHEEFLRGSVSELQKHFVAHPPRGEFTLVIAGKTTDDRQQTTDNKAAWDDATIIAAVHDLIATGVSRTDAVKRIARASGRDRREVYRLAMSS
jgi:16S rRNA (cytidine1402-2'-O)-methyltransferase